MTCLLWGSRQGKKDALRRNRIEWECWEEVAVSYPPVIHEGGFLLFSLELENAQKKVCVEDGWLSTTSIRS